MLEDNFLELIAEKSPAYIFLYQEKFLYVNKSALKALGYTKEDIKDKYVWDIIHPSQKELVKTLVKKRVNGEQIDKKYSDLKVLSKDGRVLIFRLYATTVRINNGYGGLAIGVDITKEVELEEKLKKEKKRVETILKNSYDIVLIVDSESKVKFRIPSKDFVLGWEIDELLEKPITDIIHNEDAPQFLRAKQNAFQNPGKTFLQKYRVKTKNNGYKWIEGIFHLPNNWKELDLEGIIINERDITDKVIAEEKAFRATYYDHLTELPNRVLFLEKLKDTISNPREKVVGVVILDISKFREINSAYGIKAADMVLKKISDRLKNRFKGFVVSKFYSDEFGLILNGMKKKEDIENHIYTLREIFEKPFFINGKDVYINIYIGISVYPFDGKKSEDLIRKAEIALSKAKEIGENTISLYSKSIESKIFKHVFLKQELKKALAREEFTVYYQPIINLKEKKVVGFEALVRWNHPRFGILPPAEFITIVENMDLIYELGEFVLIQSLDALSRINKISSKDFFMAVNFSARQFSDINLREKVLKTLDTYNIKPSNFILEITEETAMKNPEMTKKILQDLKEKGIKIAIDDFGTGYSSMDYLIEFDVDKIKIDKGFVIPILKQKKAQHIVRTLIKLSHSLGATAIAEGIETKHHYEKLLALKCDEGQGFYFAKPMPFEKLLNFIK